MNSYKKFIFILLLIIFTFPKSALSSESQYFSPECSMALELVKDEIDISTYSSVYSSCFKEIYVDTTSTKIGYFIFGEVYLESLKFFSMPFKMFVNSAESIINSSELFSDTELNTFISNATSVIDETKAQYQQLDSIILSGSITSIITALAYLINSVITGILVYVFIKMVWNFQQGKIEASKNFSTSIVRIISGIGLMAPFMYGYSLIQFILLGVIAFGSSVASMIFILVYLSFLNMEVDVLSKRDIQENSALYEVAAENIKSLYVGKIISNLCTIRKTEDIISSNISDSKMIKYNNEHGENNFINCLSNPNFSLLDDFYGNNVRHNRNLNYCLDNHSYFYNYDDEKIKMQAPNGVNCGEYPDNSNEIVINLVDSLKSRTENLAIKYHENECRLNYEIDQIGNNINFKCIQLNSIGSFIYNDETQNPEYFKSEQDIPSSVILSDRDDIFKNDNTDFYQIIRNANQRANSKTTELLNKDGHLEGEFDRVQREQLKSLERVIRNGWLHGFAIFMPKNLSSNIKSITSNDYFTEYRNNVYDETFLDIDFNIDGAINTTSDTNVINMYYDIRDLSYYLGLGAENNINGGGEPSPYRSVSVYQLLIGELNPFDSFYTDAPKTMSLTEKNMNRCIIERNPNGCNYSGENILSFFTVNPIDSFYHALNDMGDFIIGGYLTSSFLNPMLKDDLPIITYIFVIFSILLAIYFLATVFMVFTPFFVFVSLVLSWIYKLVKSAFFIQLFTLWYVLPSDSEKEDTVDSDGNEEKRMYKLLAEMMLMPLFVIIGVLSSFAILVIAYTIISILAFIVFSMLLPSSGGIMTTLVYFLGSYSLFLVLTTLIVFTSSRKMNEAVNIIYGYFGFENLDAEDNQFDMIQQQIKRRMAIG